MMTRLVFSISLFAFLGQAAGAQDSTAKSSRSSLSGVFTTEQATRGKYAFLGSCKSCHAPESHVGANFQRLWVGKPLLTLFKYVAESMPENDPGSLAPETNADVIAYLLQLNGMPTGPTELVADTAALRAIVVEAKPAPADTALRKLTLAPRRVWIATPAAHPKRH